MKIFSHISHFFHYIKATFYTRKEVAHSEEYYKRIAFLNHYSLLFHGLLALGLVFLIEVISRRNLFSACSFVAAHTMAYLYNAFLVFASLLLVYLFTHRTFMRILICSFWGLLGIINGCVLSNRVTPFGFTDLKCIPELFDMTESGYLSLPEIILIFILLIAFFFLLTVLCAKAPVYHGKRHKIAMPAFVAAFLLVVVPFTTATAQDEDIVQSYYANIAQGYQDNGFVYSFTSSVTDVGMNKPENYSEETIDQVMEETAAAEEETTVDGTTGPNVICVLLESYCDPDEILPLTVEGGDPIPTFHELEENYSTGYLTVPVVGAGTANTEFEILTGMSLSYFGTGEYPYKTILKQTDCESVASDLTSIGYSTHAVHNNGGNFYSRVNAFSQMGFDTFTSKELMNITDYTPTGSWAADDILVDETVKTLDSTPDQADFTYTITVGTHGTYPTELAETPEYTVTGAKDEDGNEDTEKDNQWTYYVNQLHKTDEFMAGLIQDLSERDEDTIVVFYGDHLPTMGLTDEDMKSGSIYKTKYVTWNNMGLDKEDADLYAYQLLSSVTGSVGIHEGTMMNYHQTQLALGNADVDNVTYQTGLEDLQFDILYGERYCYGGIDAYPATQVAMGIDDVTITDFALHTDADNNTQLTISGDNFTNWSKVYINGEKVDTTYVSDTELVIDGSSLQDGDEIEVCQVGSSNTIFRTSNMRTLQLPAEG